MLLLISSWEGVSNPSLFRSLWSRFSRFPVGISLRVQHSVVVPPYAVRVLDTVGMDSGKEECGEVFPRDLRLTRGTVSQPSVLSADASVLSGLRSLLSKREYLPAYVLRGEVSVDPSYVASPLVSGSDEERYLRALKTEPVKSVFGKSKKVESDANYFLKPEEVII